MIGFQGFVKYLDNYAVYDILLPFLLVFTLVFSVLQKSSFFNKEKKGISLVIALVFAFAVVIPHVTHSYKIDYDPVEVIKGIIPSMSVALIAGVMFLFILGSIFAEAEKAYNISWTFLSIVVLNMYAYKAFPSIFKFVMMMSVLGAIWIILFNPGRGILSVFPVAALLIVAYIFRNAMGWPNKLPHGLEFLSNENVQWFVILAFIIFIVSRLITEEKIFQYKMD